MTIWPLFAYTQHIQVPLLLLLPILLMQINKSVNAPFTRDVWKYTVLGVGSCVQHSTWFCPGLYLVLNPTLLCTSLLMILLYLAAPFLQLQAAFVWHFIYVNAQGWLQGRLNTTVNSDLCEYVLSRDHRVARPSLVSRSQTVFSFPHPNVKGKSGLATRD